MTISAFVMGFAQFLLLANFAYSMFLGRKVGRNPWNANGLEWTAPSPPGHGNFDVLPIVYRGPYEYGSPEVDEDPECFSTSLFGDAHPPLVEVQHGERGGKNHPPHDSSSLWVSAF
jgi:heme/copper-type cytochrome/quinol oxidase subunit 1